MQRQNTNDGRKHLQENHIFCDSAVYRNLFQQLYNTADSLIVGNFLGEVMPWRRSVPQEI